MQTFELDTILLCPESVSDEAQTLGLATQRLLEFKIEKLGWPDPPRRRCRKSNEDSFDQTVERVDHELKQIERIVDERPLQAT
jgi:hypothetical protein